MMQTLTPRLIEAYRSVFHDAAPVKLTEVNDYLRLETEVTKSAAETLEFDKLEAAISLVAPDLQKIYFDISVLPSHQIVPTEIDWKDNLRHYLDDARRFEEPWMARLSVKLDKKGIIRQSNLDATHFNIVLTCLTSTLLDKRQLPLETQLHQLFPEPHKKTVFVILDSEIFCDGPFLSLTDWAHLGGVTYSPEPFAESAKRVDVVERECSWHGVERTFLAELLHFTQAFERAPDLTGWLLSLEGALGLSAVANIAEFHGGQVHLVFWGNAKRQITLGGDLLSENTAKGARAIYSWIYCEVPHRSAALRIVRNLVARQLSPSADDNANLLEMRLPDILGSAKANYAAFIDEKLKDFFELGKEISNYANSATESLYKTLSELNESLRKSVFTTLGVVGGALLSTAAVQLNPMTYTLILSAYGIFLCFFNVWYLPRMTQAEFSERLRRFQKEIEPYREFLSPEQRRDVFEDIPGQNIRRLGRTRRLVRIANSGLVGVVLCLSGFDVPKVAKSFVFTPTWALGRAIDWLVRQVAHLL
jgi:hypothetical protein